jgi:WhiB family redox-sensing transcriptional regulator
MQRPDWAATAACRGKLHLFFPAPGERPETRARRETRAVAVCATCPHTAACLAWAVANGETEGVWGGRTSIHRAAAPALHADSVKNPKHGTYRGYKRHRFERTEPCQPCLDAYAEKLEHQRQYDKQRKHRDRANERDRERRQRVNAELAELRAQRGQTA